MRLHSSRFRGCYWELLRGTSLTLTSIALAPAGASTTTNVSVVGYSVAGPVTKALETAFQKTAAGQNVTFTNSFGASDTETNNVVNGQSADLVNLSYEPNIATLVKGRKSSRQLGTPGIDVRTGESCAPGQASTDGLPDAGHCHRLGGGLCRSSQQSAAHRHLGRSDQGRRATRHAQSAHLG